MKKNILYLSVLIGVIFIVFSFGCNKEITLKDMDITTYNHPQGGYELKIPKQWVKKLETPISAGFVGTEPATAFNVIYEIGGYDYYSLKDLADEMVVFLGESISDLQIVNESHNANESIYQFVAQGMIPQDQEVTLKGIILEPSIGIRYYLLFTAASQDFNSLDVLFDEIVDSFTMNKTSSELYLQLVERDEGDEEKSQDTEK